MLYVVGHFVNFNPFNRVFINVPACRGGIPRLCFITQHFRIC